MKAAARSRRAAVEAPRGSLVELAWRGVAWRGVAWRGVAWRGVAWRGLTWLGLAWLDLTWVGLTWRRSAPESRTARVDAANDAARTLTTANA